jgi:fructose-1,6-bisphosphatase/inositol monophosphatase family enzyme
MALVDSTILGLYDRDLAARAKAPIVGFVSTGAWTHDYAASSAIIKAAGGMTTAIDGEQLRYHPNARGCVMAATPAVHSLLLEVMAA